MNFFLDLPLADPVNGIIYVVILVGAVGLIAWTRKIKPVLFAVAAAIIAWLFLRRWDVPVHILIAGAIAIAALLRKPKTSTVVAGLLSLIALAGLVNLEYQTYPTVGSLDPRPVAQEISPRQLSTYKGQGAATVHLNLQGEKSGFQAREAIAYLPPAYFRGQRLPVIVLLHGNPGGPEQWFGSGGAAQTADQFQAANGGVSPIVIAVDATGSETGNPVCADSARAKVMTYLSQDVPAAIKKQLRVDEDQSHWSLAGLSYGGTCALQVATNRPASYGSYMDFSGQAEPTLGNHADTVTKFFEGDERAFQAQNPAHLLQNKKYPNLAVAFISGDKDKEAQSAQNDLAVMLRQAGAKSYVATLPGGHSFGVWRPALRQTFAWAAARGGIQVERDPFDGIKESDVYA
ncbi:alpha/beta hydrolase [Corynebacterium striatum]|uniref:alpha/beta hydrolase n=1 Tax=Corynebacterium striatum TaxID=43770 RepID=UPI003B5AE538